MLFWATFPYQQQKRYNTYVYSPIGRTEKWTKTRTDR